MTKKQEEITEIHTPVRIEGLESFIAGFHTLAKTSSQKENSRSVLSIGIRRPHQQTCYINMLLNTDLTTGLMSIDSISEQLTSVFHKGGQLTNFSATANQKAAAKTKSVVSETMSESDQIDDAVDELLDIVS